MDDQALEALAAEKECEQTFQRRVRTMENFRYDEQQEKYWDTTTGNLLAARSVDGAIPKSQWPTKPDGRSKNGEPKPYPPSQAINDVDTGLTVEGSTWWPGLGKFVENVVMTDRGALDVAGAICFNLYNPPIVHLPRGKVNPQPWIDHIKKLYPEPVEHEHFFDFCAHMLQRPDEKVNHGLIMAGTQGIGKDTALLPVRHGVGEHNAAEVDPEIITSQYNGFLKSVLLVINEVRPHDEEYKASNFYNMLKPLLAAPPEMLPMTLKYANTVYVRNLAHVILTTNDPLGMHIPAEDRRLFVMTSALKDPKAHEVFAPDYFEKIYAWLDGVGKEHVIKWLMERDISKFKAAAPPPMTRGKQAIIESTTQVRRNKINDVIDDYIERLYDGKLPTVIFHRDLTQFVHEGDYFDDKDLVIKLLNSKQLHFKMSEHGYDIVRNPTGKEWYKGKFRTRMAFVLREVPHGEQANLALEELQKRPLEMNFN